MGIDDAMGKRIYDQYKNNGDNQEINQLQNDLI